MPRATGSAARVIAPNGHETPIARRGAATINEQIDVVAEHVQRDVEALVIECMAVLPELQEINERKLVRSTICVICNVREDHLDEMGPTLDDVAREAGVSPLTPVPAAS